MSDYLGTDFLLDENQDIFITPDGDIKTVSGALCAAQDVRTAILEGGIVDYLNSDEDHKADIYPLLENILLDEPRVDPETIIINITAATGKEGLIYNCSLSFTCMGNSISLVFSTNNLEEMKIV